MHAQAPVPGRHQCKEDKVQPQLGWRAGVVTMPMLSQRQEPPSTGAPSTAAPLRRTQDASLATQSLTVAGPAGQAPRRLAAGLGRSYGGHVLVVDDDAATRATLRECLQPLFGANVTLVADGDAASEAARHGSSDVVLLDQRSGARRWFSGVLEELRPRPAVILLGDPGDVDGALEIMRRIPVTALHLRPLDVDLLVAEIQQQMRAIQRRRFIEDAFARAMRLAAT